ncbi:MAG TPA: hypothetical protein VIO35_01920 [Chloroflexota bacterium]
MLADVKPEEVKDLILARRQAAVFYHGPVPPYVMLLVWALLLKASECRHAVS